MTSTEDLILGIDIGTTSTKGAVLDTDLKIVTSARKTHCVSYPRPGFAEQDPLIWWEDVGQVVRKISETISLDRIQAVGISSMCPTVLPVSETGEPLRSAILYGIDSRATEEIDHLNDSLSELLTCSLYTNYSSQSILPKLMWLKKHEPRVYEKTHRFLTTSGYIVYRLTGNETIDYFTASAGNLVDLEDAEWFQQGFDACGFSGEKMPPLKWSGEVAGTVSAKAAKCTGLPEGIPVTVGTCDAAADAIVCGCVGPGDAMVSLGGTTISVACCDKPVAAPNLFVNTHAFQGLFTIGGATSSGGLMLEWFARAMLQMEASEMFRQFADLDYHPSDVVALPFLNGARTPFNDINAKALFAGMTMATDTAALYTAVLESLALDLSMILAEIEKCAIPINHLRISGGGVENTLLLRIIAEVIEREITAVSPEYDAAAGSALLAYLSANQEADKDQTCKSIPVYKSITPDGRFKRELANKKDLFYEAYEANKPVFEMMAVRSTPV